MATTTTNYGWTVPTSSDLVKNGATAISTLGQSVDTFLFRPFSKNAVINGGFDIWQRGTSIAYTASTYSYTSDRWMLDSANTCTVSRQSTNDTTNLPFIQYCARVQRNSGQTSLTNLNYSQAFESTNSIPYAGKAVTLSFYARAGANFSASSSTLRGQLLSGTGTDQNPRSGSYTGQATVLDGTFTLTTTWQRFTIAGTVGVTATELALLFLYTPTGTAGANDYYEITGVQLEVGSTATPFSRNASSIQGELAACQRYYFRFGGDSTLQPYGFGVGTGTTTASIPIVHPVTMRVAPTSIDFSTLNLGDLISVSSAISSCTIGAAGKGVTTVSIGGATGLTSRHNYFLRSDSSLSGYLGLSAEL